MQKITLCVGGARSKIQSFRHRMQSKDILWSKNTMMLENRTQQTQAVVGGLSLSLLKLFQFPFYSLHVLSIQ